MSGEASGLSSALSSLSEPHFQTLLGILDCLPAALAGGTEAEGAHIAFHAAEQAVEKWKEVLDLYQEQPHLLDPRLPALLEPLLANVRAALHDRPPAEALAQPLLTYSFALLAHLSKVRGWKVLLRLLPHEVGDLQPLLALMEALEPKDGAQWAIRYVGVQWLVILVKMPFQLSRWDGDGGAGSTGKRLLRVAESASESAEACRYVAARLLATLLCRQDLRDAELLPALHQTFRRLAAVKPADNEDLLKALARAYVFASVLKVAPRAVLRPHASSLLRQFTSLDFAPLRSTHMDKMRAKILQRLALLFLRPKPGAWRYKRGTRSLAANLGEGAGDSVDGSKMAAAEEEEEEEYEIAEEVEEVVGALLGELGHEENIVRWSAAKGLGRVAARLPREAAEDVGSSIVASVEASRQPSTWHGGCLALAELGRRGALLPAQLAPLSPLLVRALEFEGSQGRGNVDAAVRDAACFLAWSFGRTFSAEEMGPVVGKLGPALVQTALLDRELNCRRAASAAFQENVGRQGSFPKGLEIVGACDYFALSQTAHCYRELVPLVGAFDHYRPSLLSALFRLKVPHWDPSIRRLASHAIGTLTPLEPATVLRLTREQLIPMALGKDLFGRQGALFALGEVVKALLGLPEDSQGLHSDLMASISRIPGEMSRKGLVKGMGGDWVRAGLNALLQQLMETGAWRLPSLEVAKEWVDLLHDNLHNADPAIRDGAASVWKGGLWRELRRQEGSEALWKRLCDEAEARLGSGTLEVERQAAALWLAAVGAESLGPDRTEAAMAALSRVLSSAGEQDKSWAEARRDALASLVALWEELGEGASQTSARLVLDALLLGCDDYTIDVRGDIGKVVRETAVQGLLGFLLRPQRPDSQVQPAELKRALEKLIRLSCEKIDLTRCVAAEGVGRLLKELPESVSRDAEDWELLRSVFLTKAELSGRSGVGVKWMSSSEAFPRLGRLLASPAWQRAALTGLAVSAGGLTESTMRASSEALLSHVQGLDEASLALFVQLTNALLRAHLRTERVLGPLIGVVERVMESGVLEAFAEGSDAWPFLEELVGLVLEATRRKKSPAKVVAGLRAGLGALQLEWGSRASEAGLVGGLRALGHVYPRVRRQAAAALYQALLTYAVLDNHSEQALAALLNTDWDADAADTKALRRQIADLLRLPDPLPPYPDVLGQQASANENVEG